MADGSRPVEVSASSRVSPSPDIPPPFPARGPVGRLSARPLCTGAAEQSPDWERPETSVLPNEPGLAWQLVSVTGFLLLVLAYLVNQAGRCRPDSVRYLGANAVGAGMLAAYSARIDEPVFVGLEGFWCAASLVALARSRGAAERSP
jgi:hypothetical protein